MSLSRGLVWAAVALALAATPARACMSDQSKQEIAEGNLAIASKREPIAEVLADSATPAPLRARLEYVAAARDFASRELGLPDNDSYRSYADLGRPYVVWNVFAAPEFSVEPRRWCFPIVGCFVYRGYFSEEAARRARAGGLEVVMDECIGG